MATGQSLLDRMELVDQSLQLQSGEADVTRGLLALNVAQDYLESMLALIPKVWGDTTGTVTTTASTETTSFPSGVLRIDRLQWIDPATSRPSGPDLENTWFVGSHNVGVPSFLVSTGGTGRPRAYWTQGRNIYWNPLPDTTHTIRYYGLSAQTDITASSTFPYPDYAMFPLAVFAVRVLAVGTDDDDGSTFEALAEELFTPTILAMKAIGRGDRPAGYDYTEFHTE